MSGLKPPSGNWAVSAIAIGAALLIAFIAMLLFSQRAGAQTLILQPKPCAGLRITATEQYGNPAASAEFSVQQSDGDVIYGTLDNGERTICVPPGPTSVEVMGVQKSETAESNVLKTLHFNVEVQTPGSEWVNITHRGMIAQDLRAYGVWVDSSLLSGRRWSCTINNTAEGTVSDWCSQHEASAIVIALKPGAQTVEFVAQHFDTGETLSFSISVDVPETSIYLARIHN